jgi:hypothetical protein
MKSNRLYNSLCADQTRMCIAAALGSIVVFVAIAGTDADEPSEKESERALRIHTPFDPDTMPSAEELLSKNALGSAYWTAKISINATSTDSPTESSLNGTLVRYSKGLSGRLRLIGSPERQLNLLLTKTQSVAWTTQGEDKPMLERLAKGIYLLAMLIDFPDETKSRAETIGDYQLTNLGVRKETGKQSYVIEAKLKEGELGSPRISSLEAERILITVSPNDSRPLEVTSISAIGSHLSLSFQSIAIDAQEDAPEAVHQSVSAPPKDSFVIDLSGGQPSSDALKNPVAYTAESIKRGQRLYIADCEVCHSVDGTGRDSDVTDNAADLTNTEFWLSDGSETAAFLAIRDGAGDEMPGYKDDYRDEKMIWDLVNYMRSLQE